MISVSVVSNFNSELRFLEGVPIEKILGGFFNGESMSGIFKYYSGVLCLAHRCWPEILFWM